MHNIREKVNKVFKRMDTIQRQQEKMGKNSFQNSFQNNFQNNFLNNFLSNKFWFRRTGRTN